MNVFFIFVAILKKKKKNKTTETARAENETIHEPPSKNEKQTGIQISI